MILPSRISSLPNPVLIICVMRIPTKVAQAVVCRVAILVTALHPFLWRRANKGEKYSSSNSHCELLLPDPNMNLQIAIFVGRARQNSRLVFLLHDSVSEIRELLHSTIFDPKVSSIRNFIDTIKSGNISPYLLHKSSVMI